VTEAPPVAPAPTDQAVAAVRSYCGWHIAPSRTETLTLDGPGGNVLCLPSLHVTDVLSVTEDENLLDPALDYNWSEAGVLRRSWATGYWSGYSGSWWSCAMRGIRVELTHGYDEWPVELAGIIQAVADRISDNPTGLEQQTVGPFTEKYATSGTGGAGTAFAGADEAVLTRYKLPPRP
jgi:hypothetical protein